MAEVYIPQPIPLLDMTNKMVETGLNRGRLDYLRQQEQRLTQQAEMEEKGKRVEQYWKLFNADPTPEGKDKWGGLVFNELGVEGSFDFQGQHKELAKRGEAIIKAAQEGDNATAGMLLKDTISKYRLDPTAKEALEQIQKEKETITEGVSLGKVRELGEIEREHPEQFALGEGERQREYYLGQSEKGQEILQKQIEQEIGVGKEGGQSLRGKYNEWIAARTAAGLSTSKDDIEGFFRKGGKSLHKRYAEFSSVFKMATGREPNAEETRKWLIQDPFGIFSSDAGVPDEGIPTTAEDYLKGLSE